MLVVVASPPFDVGLGVGQISELMHTQALIPQLADKRSNVAVIRGLARPGDIELHASPKGPFAQRSRHEPGPVVRYDRRRGRFDLDGPVEGGSHGMA
mgnify:FL=1